MGTFKEFLKKKHLEEFVIYEDTQPISFEQWKSELKMEELIKYVNEFHKSNGHKQL